MKNIFTILYLFLLLTLISACNTNSDPKPNTSGKLKNQASAWKITKVTDIGQNTVIYQNPLPQGQYITEDYSRYKLSFTASEYTLTDKGGDERSGVWELASNETKLVLDKGVADKQIIMNIIELTDTSLKVSYIESSNKTGNRELLLEMFHP